MQKRFGATESWFHVRREAQSRDLRWGTTGAMGILTAAKPAIIERLRQEGFAVQRDNGDLFFVRESFQEHLFERIEFEFVGRDNEAAVLGMAIAAVQSIHAQFKGLIEVDSLDGLYTDPENGRVEFSSPAEVSPWIERLGQVGPSSVRLFAHRRGAELLQRTQSARVAAQQAFVQFIEPALPRGLGAIVQSLTDKQRDVVANMSSRPLVIGSEALIPEYEAALAALTLAADPDILRLGHAAVPEAHGLAFIKQAKQVPAEVMWRICLLVDMILRQRSEATQN